MAREMKEQEAQENGHAEEEGDLEGEKEMQEEPHNGELEEVEQELDVAVLLRPNGQDSTPPEEVALRARRLFGDRLPEGLLGVNEYKMYERMYGPPLPFLEEPVDLEEDLEVGAEEYGTELFREGEDGELEKVELATEGSVLEDQEAELDDEDPTDGVKISRHRDNSRLQDDIQAAIAAASASTSLTVRSPDDVTVYKEFDLDLDDPETAQEDLEDEADTATVRTHPFTAAGRFGTTPRTLPLPSETLTYPISLLFSDIPNKHIDEAASKILGGPSFPYGPTTPYASKTMPQKPIPLSANQTRMSEMEADVYLAAAMPGIYASIMSVLVEVRKRLGSHWLEKLMAREEGPRILDAGAGGAGVLAWKEVLKAEWARLHPEQFEPPTKWTKSHDKPAKGSKPLPVPYGKATVLTASAALRSRISVLLENTTFIPRLPDYAHTTDAEQAQRKQFDIIVAPHSLWSLQEDFERRNYVKTLWNMLDSDGGVLIIMEKGVPRGFEVVADAREYMLRELFAESGLTTSSSTQQTPANSTTDKDSSTTTTKQPTPHPPNRPSRHFLSRAPARIIAPCTSHAKCPMYLIPGISRQRKDYCHFSQRFVRPAYLQRMLGAKDRNHDDVKFSYVAVQKGVPWDAADGGAEVKGLRGERATERAFEGFDVDDADLPSSSSSTTAPPAPAHFTHPPPRLLLPPLKRTGHIILDLCTPSGTLERWTVTKSFGRQPYRDARKARWGDLWMLGGKFRGEKRVRLGWAHMLEGLGTGRGSGGLRDLKMEREMMGSGEKKGKGKGKRGSAEARAEKDERAREAMRKGPVRDVKGRVVNREGAPSASPSPAGNTGDDLRSSTQGSEDAAVAGTEYSPSPNDNGGDPNMVKQRKAARRIQRIMARRDTKRGRRDGRAGLYPGTDGQR